ncbi:3-dehydroquinate synthase [Akkermansiaceae bacterium]|nr:3-dehydroquinate synthase [Akkermansiaceae bacterium]
MQGQDFQIKLNATHRVRFTRDAFKLNNRLLADILETKGHSKIIVFIDRGVAEAFPDLETTINDYLDSIENLTSCGSIIQTGGEECKKNKETLQEAWDIIEEKGIDRHSYILCIGGGAYLDVIGMAAATAHRGIRFVRLPTTTLSQDDSGVGVKNGINAYGKKNFLGTFAIPYAVVNDFSFIHQQPEEERRAGLIEAVKVALVKDSTFFTWIEDQVHQLATLEPATLEQAVERSALLHAQHIAYGGDPFEAGSSRPLDFGHWSAHKIEQLTNFAVSHAEAVSIGIALDTVYAWKANILDQSSAERILNVIKTLRLPQWHSCLEELTEDGTPAVIQGLQEFREHLGGELTILLLSNIGTGENFHSMDSSLLNESISWLKNS